MLTWEVTSGLILGLCRVEPPSGLGVHAVLKRRSEIPMPVSLRALKI